MQDKLTMIMNSFNVFPAGFEQQYISVQNNLNTLSEIYDNLRKMIVTIAETIYMVTMRDRKEI